MQITDVVGQRVLLKTKSARGSYYESAEVQEYRVLEVSPSGQWARLQNMYGNKFWRAVVEITLVEVLKSFDKPKPPHDAIDMGHADCAICERARRNA